MDAATLALLGKEVVHVQWFAWFDIVGDPVRAVSGVQNVAFGAGETGDPDLDEQIFKAIPSDLVSVGDVEHSDSGSRTVTASLGGLPVEDGLLDIVEQKAKWRKREARLWFRVLEPVAWGEGGQPIAFNPLPIHRYYSGYLVNLIVEPPIPTQKIVASIENYQAALSEASDLTYLHQNEFDANDQSAAQTLAAANGVQKAGVAGGVRATPGGGGPGKRESHEDFYER